MSDSPNWSLSIAPTRNVSISGSHVRSSQARSSAIEFSTHKDGNGLNEFLYAGAPILATARYESARALNAYGLKLLFSVSIVNYPTQVNAIEYRCAPELNQNQRIQRLFGPFDFLNVYVTQSAAKKTSHKAWFAERANRWEKQTAIYSAPGATYLHKDYMSVIKRGIENPSSIIPLILKRISSRGGDWFFALEQITDENPAKDCEDYAGALTAWTKWAQDNGIFKEGDAVLPS
jgi:hypothetical protein